MSVAYLLQETMNHSGKFLSMIKFIIVSILLVSVYAKAQPTQVTPPATVTINSDAKELAQGYARAASRLSRPPITLATQKEGVVRVLEDVQSIKDSEGVLVVEVGKGLIYLINAKDVIYVTDGSKLNPKT